MGQTVIEKIAGAHGVSLDAPDRVRAGDFVTLRPRHVMTHDNTAAVLAKFRAIGAARVDDPAQPVFALDHDIQNRSEANLAKYAAIEAFAREQGITFYPAGAGIGHQMMLEQGHALPGTLVVASDSHSNIYGAVGALGTPVVRTDAAAIWATGEFWWQVPRTVQVVLDGALPEGVTGKDLILSLCGLYASGEVLNAAVEFAGEGVAGLSMDARMTVANMTTEWGALVGWFPVDEVTCQWLEQRRARGVAIDPQALAGWRADPPRPDADAHYAGRIVVDLTQVRPHVAGPDTVQAVTPLDVMAARRVAVDKAYLLSCVNSRYEDLAAAAAVLDGRRVADGVQLFVAAASREIQQRCEAEGIWETFRRAGAHFLQPGCGPCIGLGEGLLEPGEVGISATNRNFKGRMGSREARCYLASPQVVAASAVAGVICGPETTPSAPLERRWQPAPAAPRSGGGVTIVEGFPEALEGRALLVPQDNLNTDGIYSKDYTYREDVSREEMARVVMENYDPAFSGLAREGDILVGGWNFGTGSSR
ncbi:MAG TPA: homoaconitase, partial [Acidobacteria bacterium]|nr:homoaconitase [Acidobacteriota bacterium]